MQESEKCAGLEMSTHAFGMTKSSCNIWKLQMQITEFTTFSNAGRRAVARILNVCFIFILH